MASRVLGVLAGNDFDPEAMRAWFKSADLVIAADSGADTLLQMGLVPHITVGDLDSISEEAKAAQVDLRFDPDQDTTDCDKLLNLCIALGHPEITLIGLEGDLLDHVIGSLQSAARSHASVRIVMRRGLAQILKGPFEGSFPATFRVSLIPITDCDGVTLQGVKWPIENAHLDPLGLTSLSNRAAEPTVIVKMKSGTAFWFVEGENHPTWC